MGMVPDAAGKMSFEITKLAADGTVLEIYPIGGVSSGTAKSAVAFDGANIWVANESGNTVTKMSASDGTIISTYTVLRPRGIAFDGANIWVASYDSNMVFKF